MDEEPKIIIQYYRKRRFGKDTRYILDPETAANISEITGSKTVTIRQLTIMQEVFGVVFDEVLEPKKQQRGTSNQ